MRALSAFEVSKFEYTQQVSTASHQRLIIMPKAYSEDLRWRAVWLHLIRRLSYAEIADVLFMCKKSVKRYIDLFNFTGSVAPTEHSNGPQRLLTEFEQITVVQSVLITPTWNIPT